MLTLTNTSIAEILEAVKVSPVAAALPHSSSVRTWQAVAMGGTCPYCKQETIETHRIEGRDWLICNRPVHQCGFGVHAPDAEVDTMEDLTETANEIVLHGTMWPAQIGQVVRDPKTGTEELVNVEGAIDMVAGEVVMFWYPGRAVSRRLLVTMEGHHWLQLDNGYWIPAPVKYVRFHTALVQRRIQQVRQEAA